MALTPFVGRAVELANLQRLFNKKFASLAVITGRRRIGKSRLIEEFARQITQNFGISGLKADNWGDLLTLVAKQTTKNKVILLFDEISWMGSLDPTFLGQLKIVWDTQLKQNPQLILILCGSVSSWIEENIASSTGYFGRISHKIVLSEFTLPECKEFFGKSKFKGSKAEQLMILNVTGGVPWYLELINPSLSAAANIKNLCFSKDGILVDEYRYIFHDLFGKRNLVHRKIIESLIKQPLEYQQIAKAIDFPSGGPLTEYLNELILSGFVQRYFSWDIQSGKETTKISKYRVSDNYLRFYIKHIAPAMSKIKRGHFNNLALTEINRFNTIMGFQFENLVLHNRQLIFTALGIHPADIINDNPYFQRQTLKQKGCQIDYLIQTRFKTLYVCEMKFSQNEISTKVIAAVREKIERLKYPRGFACIPILIHANSVSQAVIESDYFPAIIDVSEALNNE